MAPDMIFLKKFNLQNKQTDNQSFTRCILRIEI